MNSTRIISACLWCGSTNLVHFAERFDKVKILECTECLLIMLGEIPDNLQEHYYNESYYTNPVSNTEIGSGYGDTYDLMAPAFLLWEQALISAILDDRKGSKMLEIGCATGALLDLVREISPDIEAVGIDISEYAALAARKKGHSALAVKIENYNANNKFDLIFSSETLEHLDEPKSFLRGVKSNIKSNGAFLFYVPSINREQALSQGQEYMRFTSNLEHILHFTPEFLSKALKDYFGFDVQINEFDAGFGPYIVGMVTKDRILKENYLNIISGLTADLSNIGSGRQLTELAVIALKFGKFDLATKIVNVLKKDEFGHRDRLNLILGLQGYHSGEVVKSSRFFENYLVDNPGSQMALKSLLANERILRKVYEEEFYGKIRELEELKNGNESQKSHYTVAAVNASIKRKLSVITNRIYSKYK